MSRYIDTHVTEYTNNTQCLFNQMREIELCPGCYSLTVKQPKDWFCIPCVSGVTFSNLCLSLLKLIGY